jgi:hypothetical protein
MKSAEKKKPEQMLDVKEISQYLDYSPETGNFIWKVKTKTSNVGDVAGNTNWRGYTSIWINGNQYYAHRLAWALHYGSWPNCDVDHINENKSDNRICNLRQANRSQNMFNRGRNKNNTSGFKGVIFCKDTGRWRAQMSIYGKSVNIGRFDTKEDAANAYLEKAKELRGEFAKC